MEKVHDILHGTVSNTATAHSGNVQVVEKLEKDSVIFYDLVDLAEIFKVTQRTLFNWRAKGILPLVEFGGKLYLTHKMLVKIIEQKGGVL